MIQVTPSNLDYLISDFEEIKTFFIRISNIAINMSSEAFLLDYHLRTLKFLVRCGGLSLESKRINLKDKIKARILFVLNILWLNSDVVGGIFWFADALTTGSSIVGLTRIAPCAIFSSISNSKGYFFILHEDDINELIDELGKLETKINSKIKTKETLRILKDETKFLSLVLKMSNILNAILLVTFAVSPLILMAYKFLNTKELDLMLPFLVIYPFDWKDLRIWPFGYIHQIWSETVAVLYVCTSDYLFYICCTFIRIQFRFLQYSVENITDDSCCQKMKTNLSDIIKWHQELIRLANKLEIVYREATLFNFLCSSIVICLTGFSVIANEDMAFRITFLVFLSTSLLQIFLLCFFGDMLMRSSMDVVDAVYKSKWYQAKSAVNKSLLLIQTRAQKPCKLTAAGFADVNLPQFTKILRTAWSYFALLKTVCSSVRT